MLQTALLISLTRYTLPGWAFLTPPCIQIPFYGIFASLSFSVVSNLRWVRMSSSHVSLTSLSVLNIEDNNTFLISSCFATALFLSAALAAFADLLALPPEHSRYLEDLLFGYRAAFFFCLRRLLCWACFHPYRFYPLLVILLCCLRLLAQQLFLHTHAFVLCLGFCNFPQLRLLLGSIAGISSTPSWRR